MRNILLFYLSPIIMMILISACSKNKIEIPHLKKIDKIVIWYEINKTDTIISNEDFKKLITNYTNLKHNNTICNDYFNAIKIRK